MSVVVASVEPATSGYRIVSPCCSRTIDQSGGIIDIARLEYDESLALWQLYGKDHARNQWRLYFNAHRLAPLMNFLNEDPTRVFWQ